MCRDVCVGVCRGVCVRVPPSQAQVNRVNCELCCLQYMLSQQTIDALKKPAFDVWLWEVNEVRLSILLNPSHPQSPSLLSPPRAPCPSFLCVCSTICLRRQ